MSTAVVQILDRLYSFNSGSGQTDRENLRSLENAQFEEEISRWVSVDDKKSLQTTSPLSTSSIASFPKRINPLFRQFFEKLSSIAVTMELDVRASQIEEFDNVAHKKVLDALSCNGARKTIDLEEYMVVVEEIRGWRRDRLKAGLPSHADAPKGVPVMQRIPDDIPFGDRDFSTCVAPDLTVGLFNQCPRSPTGRVDVKLLFHRFCKQVALLKCEAELTMWDSDNDGKLSAEEFESYVKFLVPSLPSLSQTITEDTMPFYACAVVRRFFWTLDATNRGFIRIPELVKSPIMDEWLDMQLVHDDPPRNWFSHSITSQLYEKFLALDSEEKGMLTATDMQQYKKGVPMVLDDGLPPSVSPISSLFIQRIFEVSPLYKSEMDYKSFVDFVIAIEFLPQCHRPLFFWNAFDLECTGVITPMVAMHFFRETYQKLVTAGCEPPPLELVIQELFDVIPTKQPLQITREEFIKSSQCGLFSALLIDCLAFWTYENREQK